MNDMTVAEKISLVEQTLAFGRRHRACVRDLLVPARPVTPATNNIEVADFFHGHPDVTCVAVVEDELPIGIINRNLFMEGFARPFGRDIFGKKSCIAYMDKAPLVVEGDLSIEDLSQRAVAAGEKVLKDGYIVTEAGRYIGIGTGFELMRALSEMQAEKHRIVRESIEYASVIQQSFLRESQHNLASTLKDWFMWWEPRDVVGGDCYFARRSGNGDLLFAVIDCTGHGVPGAFMTLIVISFLENALAHLGPNDPAALLARVSREVKQHLSQQEERNFMIGRQGGGHQSDEGFDGAVCLYRPAERQLLFAGAKANLFLIRPDASGVEIVDGDRMGVGYGATPPDYAWSNRSVQLDPGTALYLTTDGLIDQLGGPKHIAFGKRRLRELLRETAAMPMADQQIMIQQRFRSYQGESPRRDDVTVFGLRVE